MAIAEIDSASIGGTGTTDIALEHGMAISAGDVLVAFIHADVYTTTQVDNNGATPFTSVHNFVVPANASAGYIWSRVAGSSEPATYHWTMNASPSFSCVLRQFRGVDETVWEVAPSAATDDSGSSNTATAPDITITNNGAMGLFAVYVDSSTLTCSAPTNSYGTEVEVGNRELATYIRGPLSPGAVGTVSATIGLPSVDDWVAVHCALKMYVAPAAWAGLTVTRLLQG